jgi:FkbM family methyltransferase
MKNKILKYFGHQLWIPFGVRDRVIRFFSPINPFYSFEFISLFFGYKYKGNLNSYIDWCVFFYGSYEYQTLKNLQYIFKKYKCKIVLDIGANVGHHSLFFSKFCEHVYAFEPFQDYSRLIREKIEINSIKNISILNFGLSNSNDEILFYAPDNCQPNKGVGSFVRDYNSNLVASKKIIVQRGDDFVNSSLISDIDFIKIDVEGLEKEVLEGLSMTINKNLPLIYLEFSQFTSNKIGGVVGLDKLLQNKYDLFIYDKKNLLTKLSLKEDVFSDILCIPKIQ